MNIIKRIKYWFYKFSYYRKSFNELLKEKDTIEDKYAKTLAKLYIEKESKTCLINSIEDYSKRLSNSEDKYLKLSIQISKEVLDFEKRLTQFNTSFLETTTMPSRQGEDATDSQNIALDLKEFSLYPLFHRYSISKINKYLCDIGMQYHGDAREIVNFTYLYAH